MVKLVLSGSQAPLVGAGCCFEAARSTLSVENVAMPLPSVAAGALPESVPVPTSDSDTSSLATGFVNASVTLTFTAGAIAAPAAALLGWTSNATVAAAPALIEKLVLSVGPAPEVEALSCLFPARSTLRAENVAIPLASVALGALPDSVPVPTRPSDTSSEGTGFVNASVTLTLTAGVMVAPAPTLEGCTSNATFAAAACTTVIASACVSVLLAESVTLTTKLLVPAVFAVPAISPVPGVIESPVGSAPPSIENV